MSFPFSYPKPGPGYAVWQSQLWLRPLRQWFDHFDASLGMAAPPKLLTLTALESAIVRDGNNVELDLAGQKHPVVEAKRAMPKDQEVVQWYPAGASAYWLASAYSLLWLPDAVGQPHWNTAKRLYLSWEKQVDRLQGVQGIPIIFSADVVGQRLLSLLRTIQQIVPEQDLVLYNKMRRRVMDDALFLSRVDEAGQWGWSRLSSLEGQCAFAASFDGLESWRNRLLDQVLVATREQWQKNGAHESADVTVSIAAFVSLANAHACLGRLTAAQADQMGKLAEIKSILDKASRLLAIAIVGPEMRVARFSGFPCPSGKQLLAVLEKAKSAGVRSSFVSDAPWTTGQAIVPSTAGDARARSLSVWAYNAVPNQCSVRGKLAFHAGLGAIEIASEAGVLFGGCGVGADVSYWGKSLRASQAFSTFCLANGDAIQVLPSSSRDRAFPVPQTVNLSQHRVGEAKVIELSHDGYSTETENVQIYRRLRIAEDANRIDGEDRLEIVTTEKRSSPQAFIRFQFSPKVKVTQDRKTRLLIEQLPSVFNEASLMWELVLTNGEVLLEEGLWFDDNNKPRQSPNAAVTAAIQDGKCIIFWRLKRLDAAGKPDGA